MGAGIRKQCLTDHPIKSNSNLLIFPQRGNSCKHYWRQTNWKNNMNNTNYVSTNHSTHTLSLFTSSSFRTHPFLILRSLNSGSVITNLHNFSPSTVSHSFLLVACRCLACCLFSATVVRMFVPFVRNVFLWHGESRDIGRSEPNFAGRRDRYLKIHKPRTVGNVSGKPGMNEIRSLIQSWSNNRCAVGNWFWLHNYTEK
jgi:hypothetical protein